LKTFFIKKDYDFFKEEAPGNSVPAAAVIQGELVLFHVIRRKEFVGYLTG